MFNHQDEGRTKAKGRKRKWHRDRRGRQRGFWQSESKSKAGRCENDADGKWEFKTKARRKPDKCANARGRKPREGTVNASANGRQHEWHANPKLGSRLEQGKHCQCERQSAGEARTRRKSSKGSAHTNAKKKDVQCEG